MMKVVGNTEAFIVAFIIIAEEVGITLTESNVCLVVDAPKEANVEELMQHKKIVNAILASVCCGNDALDKWVYTRIHVHYNTPTTLHYRDYVYPYQCNLIRFLLRCHCSNCNNRLFHCWYNSVHIGHCSLHTH